MTRRRPAEPTFSAAHSAADADMERQLRRAPCDRVAGPEPLVPEQTDGSSDPGIGAFGGSRVGVLHLTGALAFLSSIAAVFAVQLTVQPPVTYAVQGALLSGLALFAVCLVRVNRKALKRLSLKARVDLLTLETRLTEIANRDDLHPATEPSLLLRPAARRAAKSHRGQAPHRNPDDRCRCPQGDKR